ncbi:beta-tubulin cofactor D, putative [Theileria equi strain WA]|uniref:Beta-tubulin cofactor D, putative n=1 Tax=Theileria equi strain WA TaxID=1537102 RepID=L0B2I8_THEEQ|nr:beta-tubulin cofactor D, putative [Theileria equi strain WA]AFZ81708.1 beta-tubulin cofactor D, putative [Theileria equi strain WA]|eukprot:XP_004831374.1 beta-tubulin cofactor D, putative [Theileria equi strain WA]
MYSENVQCDTTFFSDNKEVTELLNEVILLSETLIFEEVKNETCDDVLDKYLPNFITRINSLSEIICKYMNNQILLYQYVESLVTKVFAILNEFTSLPIVKKEKIICYSGCQKVVPRIVLEHLCYYLYIVGKCVGIRRLILNAPNKVHLLKDLTEIMEMIQRKDVETFDIAINKYEDHKWCLEYIILSWQSLLIYTPFELERIWKDDSGITLKERIINVAMYYIDKPTKARDGAAMVISNLFSRHDIANQDFPLFLEYCSKIMENKLSYDHFTKEINGHLIIGILIFIKQILKRMSKSDIIPHLETFEFLLLQCSGNVASSMCRKLHASCFGRLAIHILPSQVAFQKYKRACKTILSQSHTQEDASTVDFIDSLYDHKFDQKIELIVSKLLEYLNDKDIRVRWASAKSIGRMSMKLQMEHNQQLISHIVDLISLQVNDDGSFSIKSESIVHGGCLAIAEMIRNGVLYPSMLEHVLECAISTLSFDVWRGKGSAGTAVRDASCYILWAIARNFKNEMLNPTNIVKISEELINVTLFDLSINCRRAAGAVLQELVGRQNSVPFGLDLITIANYYSISNIHKSFIEVSYNVAKLGFYNLSMIRYLVRTKLYHPDMETRELSAIAISKITSLTSDIKTSIFKDNINKCSRATHVQLIELLISDVILQNVSTMHGALRGLTHILSKCLYNSTIMQNYIHEIIKIPVMFEKKRLFRGKGGNIVREAICKLIATICKFEDDLLYSPEFDVLNVYIVILKDCLRNFSLSVQLASVEALKYLLQKLAKISPKGISSIVNFLIDSLRSKNEHIAARRGYALSISTIPLCCMKLDVLETLLSLLCHEINLNAKSELIKDVQTRQFALLSILMLMEKSKDISLGSDMLNEVVKTITICCSDYEVDSRGDVGSLVRELTSEVIVFILMQYFKGMNSYPLYRSFDCNMATNLTICLVELSLDVLEHIRARSSFLLSHLFFQKDEFDFDVEWLWNRIFYNIPYEHNIWSYTTVKSLTEAENVKFDGNIKYEQDKVKKTIVGMKMLESISSNLISTIKGLNVYKSELKFENNDNSFGSYRAVSQKTTSALRIYGWSSATLVFQNLLPMLLVPKYISVVINALVKIIGSNVINDSFIDANHDKILVLENILIDFIHTHKNNDILWDGSPKKIEDVIICCITEIYEDSINANDSKMSSKIVSTIKLFASHNLITGHKWSKSISMMILESKRATNYSYLKTIIKCLQILYINTDMENDIMNILLWFLSHKYPTIRTYVSSVLNLILNCRNSEYNDEIIEILTTFAFDTENSENISNMIHMLRKRLIKS